MLRQVREVMLVVAAVGLVACAEKNAPKAAAPAPQEKAPQAAATPPAGERVETEAYAVAIAAQAGGGTITVTAKPPLHVNPDYPMAFRPEPGAVSFGAERVALTPSTKTPCADKAEDACEVVTPLAFTAQAGQTVAGTVLFSVCEPEKCLIEKVKVAAVVK